jgi:hypothetical protein
MRKICLITLVGAGLALGSCAPKEEEEDKKNSVNLEGTWTQACQSAQSGYAQMKLIFSDGSLTVRNSTHLESDCSDEFNTMDFVGEYETGDDADHETDVSGATPIDIAMSAITMTPATDAAVTAATSMSVDHSCTSLTFTVDTATDISACPDMTGSGPAVNATWHQIFKADEDSLYFGDFEGTKNGSTEALTPTALESKAFNRS